MWSATSRALRGDMRTHLATARTSWVSTALIGQPRERFVGPRDAFRPEFSSQTGRVACSLGPLDLRLAIAGMATEHPRRRELAELVADHRHAPWRHRMAAALRLALAAAVRMVDRVHRRAAHRRALAAPAAAAGLAAGDVLVVDVADLADGRPARQRNAAHLARGQAQD